LFGLSRAMPAKLAARNPDPVWVTTTVYIDVWNTVTDDFGSWPTGGPDQNNGECKILVPPGCPSHLQSMCPLLRPRPPLLRPSRLRRRPFRLRLPHRRLTRRLRSPLLRLRPRLRPRLPHQLRPAAP
jgi:hypothetical protein